MHASTGHISEEQLLLYADGELSAPKSATVRTHIEACSSCRERLSRIESMMHEASLAIKDISDNFSGSETLRALLKAEILRVSQEPTIASWQPLRFARGLAYACALALLLATGARLSHRQSDTLRLYSSRPLPDPDITPGSTRDVSLTEICSEDRDEVVRDVPTSLQRMVFQEYGLNGTSTTDFEVDYLITPGLGGSDDVRNLWPEPHSNTVWNSYVKDQLEDRLHRMVCDRKLSLNEAQKDIANDWIAAYKKYFHTEQPLATSQPPSLTKIRIVPVRYIPSRITSHSV